ncbi:MAG: hypothetical protein BGO77_03180 [Caedibacter sp. 37-49]|nr:MAG: hypothetical protein BGO77_03180 [Caedibacter sp. 37-49]
MHKRILKLKAIICIYFLSFINASTTELIIRAQDDEIEKDLKVKLVIQQPVSEGPYCDKLEVITDPSKKALKDANGNFINYDLDEKNNIAPHLFLRAYHQRKAHVSTSQEGKIEQFEVKTDKDGIDYIGYNQHVTFDIPQGIVPSNYYYSKPYKEMMPLDRDGRPLKVVSVDQMPFFDAVSVFGTVWHVFKMYEEDIQYMDSTIRMKWQNRKTTRIYPHMTETQYYSIFPDGRYKDNFSNAFHTSHDNYHLLCFFPRSDMPHKFTSQSFDIVAHEAGHNVLSILKPELEQLIKEDSEEGAFHEAFGDLTTFFALSSIQDIAKRVIEVTKNGNLKATSFFSILGEAIAERDAASLTDLSRSPSCEVHDYSVPLTKAVYGILADSFLARKTLKERKNLLKKGEEVSLLIETSKTLRKLFLQSVVSFSFKDPNFAEFGREMATLAYENPSFSFFTGFIYSNFAIQGIDLQNKNWARICIPTRIVHSNSLRYKWGCQSSTRHKKNVNKKINSALQRLSLSDTENTYTYNW